MPGAPGAQPGEAPGPDGGGTTAPAEDRPAPTRFFGSKVPQPDRCASSFKDVLDEVLGPLAATPGVSLTVTLEIEATAPPASTPRRSGPSARTPRR